jgi:cell division septation protein DedD
MMSPSPPKPAPPKPPAPAPAPQRVASAEPTALPAAPSASEAVATGGFAVQLGVSSTEADAKATLQRLQGKHAALGGLAPMIRKAEVNGNTVYRVRVGPFPREDASALCSKIQGQGGQCFVAKN